jgi:serine phosphatase RsbU (regulator of sigma subunit)
MRVDRLLATHALHEQTLRQRDELSELRARHDREIEVVRAIFDRVFEGSHFQSSEVRHLVLPADRLPGDFLLGTRSGADTYRWMIGDVTGHTLSSALVTLPLANTFYGTAKRGMPLLDVLDTMEHQLAAMLPASMFCVAAILELDRSSGVLRAWNGGNPDVLLRHVTGGVTRIPSSGPPLGAERYTTPTHALTEHPVVPGDRVFAFSDGLLEIRDRRGNMIGFDRLLKIAETGSAQTIFGRFLDCTPDYTGATAYDDDVSLIEVIV